MKPTLKNRPEILVLETGKFAKRRIWCNPEKSAEWFNAFEKRQRSFLFPVNMGEWIRKNSDAKSIGELLTRYIEKEVLGGGAEKEAS